MKTKKEIKPYALAAMAARFINEGQSYDPDWDEPENDAVVSTIEEKWMNMVNEVEAKLHFGQVVAQVAKKYFPAAAPKIASWVAANVKLICCDEDYPEDWVDFGSLAAAERCATAHSLGIAGMNEADKKEELDETEPEDGEGDDA